MTSLLHGDTSRGTLNIEADKVGAPLSPTMQKALERIDRNGFIAGGDGYEGTQGGVSLLTAKALARRGLVTVEVAHVRMIVWGRHGNEGNRYFTEWTARRS